jgi:protein-L-isoaspartate(D-aspartate) O-methyltransferase
MSREPTSSHNGALLRGLASAWALVLALGCNGTNGANDANGANGDSGDGEARGSSSEADFAYERERMVVQQLQTRGVRDPRVLAAMRTVRRHRYAPDGNPKSLYEDRPQPIGHGQTISQPYIVALMSELARLDPPCKVLEVGTGSGYQAAVLAEMGCDVYTIEIVEPLALLAQEILAAEGYTDRVHVRAGDGYRGWPELAPFDAVLVTAAAPRVPQPLLDQLRIGGRLVIPVGEDFQILEVHRRSEDGIETEQISGVRFVPMTGEVRESR